MLRQRDAASKDDKVLFQRPKTMLDGVFFCNQRASPCVLCAYASHTPRVVLATVDRAFTLGMRCKQEYAVGDEFELRFKASRLMTDSVEVCSSHPVACVSISQCNTGILSQGPTGRWSGQRRHCSAGRGAPNAAPASLPPESRLSS